MKQTVVSPGSPSSRQIRELMQMLAKRTNWHLVGQEFMDAYRLHNDEFVTHVQRFMQCEALAEENTLSPHMWREENSNTSRFFREEVAPVLLRDIPWQSYSKQQIQKIIEAQKRVGERFTHYLSEWSASHQ